MGGCQVCLAGFELREDGGCSKLPEGCSNTDGNGLCTSCVAGWILDGSNICQQLG